MAISHEIPCVMEEKVFIERCEESLGGVSEQLVHGDCGVSEEESRTEANIDDEHVDGVGNAHTAAIFWFKSAGFTFSEIV